METIDAPVRVWNPVRGCPRPDSGACSKCWARAMAESTQKANYPDGFFHVQIREDRLHGRDTPESWTQPAIVEVVTMGDLFAPGVPFDFVREVFRVCLRNDRHAYIIQTKYAARARQCLTAWSGWREAVKRGDADHIYIGISAETNAALAKRLPSLVDLPAANKLITLEPLWEPIQLPKVVELTGSYAPGAVSRRQLRTFGRYGVNWIRAGGEYGRDAASTSLGWFRSLATQAELVGVPFYITQLGSNLGGKRARGNERFAADSDLETARLPYRQYPDRLGAHFETPKEPDR